jgi:Flp pilus assembly pilin Flp
MIMGQRRWGGRRSLRDLGRGRADRGSATVEVGVTTTTIAVVAVGFGAGVQNVLGAKLSILMDDLRLVLGS